MLKKGVMVMSKFDFDAFTGDYPVAVSRKPLKSLSVNWVRTK